MTPAVIPDAKQEAVKRALHSAFGARDFEDLTLLTGGLSTALVFRVVVRGHQYLLRLVMPGAPAGGTAARQLACMRIAADAGLAPRIVYANEQDGLLLSDYVRRQPFPADVAVRLATTIRRLHALDGFPVVMNYLERIDGFVRNFRAAPPLPQGVTAELLQGYDEIWRVYPQNRDLVACHNDLKADNILFDGTRLWLVDWEAAFVNDRYADLAYASTFFVHDEATEHAYLSTYFDGSADKPARARFFLMRLVLSVFGAALILPAAAKAGLPIDVGADLPDFREFHRRWVNRQVTLENMQERRDWALVHVREALEQMRSPRFKEALAIVARRETSHAARDFPRLPGSDRGR